MILVVEKETSEKQDHGLRDQRALEVENLLLCMRRVLRVMAFAAEDVPVPVGLVSSLGFVRQVNLPVPVAVVAVGVVRRVVGQILEARLVISLRKTSQRPLLQASVSRYGKMGVIEREEKRKKVACSVLIFRVSVDSVSCKVCFHSSVQQPKQNTETSRDNM